MTKDKVKSILSEIGIQYKENSSNGYINARCPICGDSTKNQRKKRFWILCNSDSPKVGVFCHNCSYSSSFQGFLKEYYQSTYFKHLKDFERDNKKEVFQPSKVVEIIPDSELVKEDLKYILNEVAFPIMEKQNSLTLNNLRLNCLKYLVNRKIPVNKISEMYVGYKTYTDNEGIKLYLDNRIIIPYFSLKKEIYAFQGRTLIDNDFIPKYITYKGNNEIKIYNYFGIDKSKRVYVTEGPIDSFFIDNSISLSGTVAPNSDVIKLLKKRIKDLVFCFDNDSAGYDKTESFLDAGFKCFKWPYEWKKYKDMNDIILNDKKKCLTNSKIVDIIDHNVIKGSNGVIKLRMGGSK